MIARRILLPAHAALRLDMQGISLDVCFGVRCGPETNRVGAQCRGPRVEYLLRCERSRRIKSPGSVIERRRFGMVSPRRTAT